jgi:hypothetical protein
MYAFYCLARGTVRGQSGLLNVLVRRPRTPRARFKDYTLLPLTLPAESSEGDSRGGVRLYHFRQRLFLVAEYDKKNRLPMPRRFPFGRLG